MSITDATWPWAGRASFGTFHFKNLYNISFGYTSTQKKIAAGTTTAVLAATAGSSSAQTLTSGNATITQPDVPRALKLTVGGTASGVQAGSVIVTGTNVEGAVITESFVVPIGGTGTYNGVKAFKSVTSIYIPAQVGATATFALGTLNVLGLRHRLFNQNTTVKIYTATAAYGALTLQSQPTVVASENRIENNTVLPASLPDGTKFFVICYAFDSWADGTSFQDQPEYSFTTSTSSTSSSTSTTTITTSTSSTSISTSSTSVSTSSTSSSTSSTSTSTTTAP